MNYSGKINKNVDVKTTLESGQTFLWNKCKGNMFEDDDTNSYYYTVRKINGKNVFVKVKSDNTQLIWESNSEKGFSIINSTFRLETNLDKIKNKLPHDKILNKSIKKYPDLKIVNEPLFPTLISFICSIQMRVERIHNMVKNISKKYGSSVHINGKKYYGFPTPDELSEATNSELKDLKTGYRAEYILKTTNMITSNTHPLELPDNVSEAREYLKEYVGVGPKVADCVLLYGGGFNSVVPVDTWIDKAAKKYYPDCVYSSKEKTARALENKFGEYSGFAQAYLFHYMRNNTDL